MWSGANELNGGVTEVGERMKSEPVTSSSIVIEAVLPEIDGGRWPIKREMGDRLEVSADIFKEGHDVLACLLRYRPLKDDAWREVPMEFVDNDRWAGHFDLTLNARYRYSIGAYVNLFESWRIEVTKKLEAGERIESELLEGRTLVEATAQRATDRTKPS